MGPAWEQARPHAQDSWLRVPVCRLSQLLKVMLTKFGERDITAGEPPLCGPGACRLHAAGTMRDVPSIAAPRPVLPTAAPAAARSRRETSLPGVSYLR